MGRLRAPGGDPEKPGKSRSSRRGLTTLALAALCLQGGTAGIAEAGTRTSAGRSTPRPGDRRQRQPILSPWEQAERARDSFEARPEGQRTREQFNAVMDRFRLIYHTDPHDPHAAEAIHTVAELLTEEGRELHDPRSLQAAVGQYEFLRVQYPGSPLRVGALLAEAQIQQNDLQDAAAARDNYHALLRLYPRSSLAEQARSGLAALSSGARSAPAPTVARATTPSRQESTGRESAPDTSLPPSRSSTAPRDVISREPASAIGSTVTVALPPPRLSARSSGPVAMVSGIRHWSTPSYTRVVIDLGDEVQYEAARVPSPDRIFFDLHGAHLASDLVGKSFSVTDDGFLRRIRAAQPGPDVTRVVLDVNDVSDYSAFLLPNPYRLIIDIHGRADHTRSHPAAQEVASADTSIARGTPVPNTRAVRSSSPADVNALPDQPGKVDATPAPTSQPIAATVPGREGSRTTSAPLARTTPADARVVGDPDPAATARSVSSTERRVRQGSRLTPADGAVVGVPARAAERTSSGETSLVRALGLKINRIVIDPGHGGHDSGTIGAGGLEEKDVVLDVALRLGKLLRERLGADVTFTRDDDTFIPLETRTAIANKAQADLFLSIHANSSSDPKARGVETYYLNFTQQADALEVAARENAVSGQSIHQLSDLVRKITLSDKLAESREFATDVESSLYGGLARGNEGMRNRGVKKAPFVVLIGANMPSVLAEISFVTNPKDAAELRQAEGKQRVAESLYRGIARYVGSLSSAGPASPPTERASRQ